jgi:hypothetical protein
MIWHTGSLKVQEKFVKARFMKINDTKFNT